MAEYTRQVHTFGPVFDKNSRILILGSFPSVKSREQMFYYGHPANRFWRVIAHVVGWDVPQSIDQKRDMLLLCGIALWDAAESCDIIGSGDSSIKNVVPNDVRKITDFCDIRRIYANGGTAFKIYQKHIEPATGREIFLLPSTSPANAAWSLEKLCEEWMQIKNFL